MALTPHGTNSMTKVLPTPHGTHWIEHAPVKEGERAYIRRKYPPSHRNAGHIYIKPSPKSFYGPWETAYVYVHTYPDGRQERTAFRDFDHALDWFSELERSYHDR